MAGAREGMRVARALGARRLQQHSVPTCAKGFASSQAAKKDDPLADLETTSAFSSKNPDEAAVKAFQERKVERTRENQLPGSR